jgi:hypothetical protein
VFWNILPHAKRGTSATLLCDRWLGCNQAASSSRTLLYRQRVLVQGAHEIQSYCLGHTDFVTSCTFAATPESTLLLSTSGDGTVRCALLASSFLGLVPLKNEANEGLCLEGYIGRGV